MAKLSNKIVKHIPFDMKQKHRKFDQTEKFFVNKVRLLKIHGMDLKIKLSKKVFDKIFEV